ncbi:MAG: CBS domain-containing protein [Spirochaetaceae bacterium]
MQKSNEGGEAINIIVGHSNMDLDCIGSIAMAKYLFPDHIPFKSRHIHPVAQKLENLYQYRLDFHNPKELEGTTVEHMVIVDTRTRSRLKEYLQYIDESSVEIEIFDHHPLDEGSFEGALLHQRETGANTSQLVLELMNRDIRVSPEDATIALAGIYADTGNFTHENVSDIDFTSSAYLLTCGARLEIIQTVLKPLSANYQITLFHDLLNRLQYRTIHGQHVILSYHETEEESEGLGAVTEKVFEVENQDVYFALFHFPKRRKTLIISRNRKHNIDLNRIMDAFGGGGHRKAASAVVKGRSGAYVFSTLIDYLEKALAPAVTAEEIMAAPVTTIDETVSLFDASRLLEEISHTGVPVTRNGGEIAGFLTLRDIMKGRRADQMHAPVKGYMSKKIITAGPDTTVGEIETIMFTNNIGHLPIVEEEKVVGIVTRSDYLNFIQNEHLKRQRVKQKIGLLAG